VGGGGTHFPQLGIIYSNLVSLVLEKKEGRKGNLNVCFYERGKRPEEFFQIKMFNLKYYIQSNNILVLHISISNKI